MAFQHHLNVDDRTLAALADPGGPDLAAEELRPQLEALANLELDDPLMAGLVAQQVVVDFCSRDPTDFTAPGDLAAWLEIRLAQTMALFAGMLGSAAIADAAPAPPLPSRPRWRRSRWGLLGGIPGLVGATSIASVLAAAGAVAVTVGSTYGPSSPNPGLVPVAQSPLAPRAVLTPPPPSPSTPTSPARTRKTNPKPSGTPSTVPATAPLAAIVPAKPSPKTSTAPTVTPSAGKQPGSGSSPSPPAPPKNPSPSSGCPTPDQEPCHRGDSGGGDDRGDRRDDGRHQCGSVGGSEVDHDDFGAAHSSPSAASPSTTAPSTSGFQQGGAPTSSFPTPAESGRPATDVQHGHDWRAASSNRPYATPGGFGPGQDSKDAPSGGH